MVKKAANKKNGNGAPDTDGFQAPSQLVVKIPAGTRDFCTFLIKGTGLGILQHSCRGMVLDELEKMKEEEARRANPDQVATKKEKVIRLPEETAELGTYPTNDGRFYHPSAAFVGSLIDGLWAAKAEYPGTKELACNVLQRTVRMTHEQTILVDPKTFEPFGWKNGKDIKKPPYIIDFRTAVNQNTGGRILTWRPLWKKWAAFVTLSFDAAQVQRSVLLQALTLGGDLVGVGTFRPLPPRNLPKKGKGGPFGTFEVEFWDKDVPESATPEL